jgi:hypothetical protein
MDRRIALLLVLAIGACVDPVSPPKRKLIPPKPDIFKRYPRTDTLTVDTTGVHP